MSTNSIIAKQYEDGTIRSIYCHWDGYYEYNGDLLNKYYPFNFKIEALLDLGDISSLGATLYPSPAVKKYGFDYSFGSKEYRELTEKEREEYFQEGSSNLYTTSYIRDRGENVPANKHDSFADFLKYLKNSYSIEFVYLFKDDEWYAWENGTLHSDIEDATFYNYKISKLKDIMKEIEEENKEEED